jgi:transcriptional regulator with XRE-family HTH domain
MAKPCRGRPPQPVDPEASHGHRLGFEIRSRRIDLGLTLDVFGERVGYTAQYISEVERAKATPAQPFIAACERALDAHGKLEPLLPAALQEREQKRQERAAARRAANQSSLPCEDHSEAGDDEDVKPTNRRGLLGAGATAALGASVVVAVPTQARQIDRSCRRTGSACFACLAGTMTCSARVACLTS